MTVWFITLPLAAYVLGSISFAWLAGKIKGVDLRQHGSGNLGATNAGRVLGKQWFAIVFLCDVAKGLLPVLAAQHLPGLLGVEGATALQLQALQLATALGAIFGHVFTFFHGFRGGKAVATSLGVLIGLLPLLAACLAGVWLVTWLIAAFAFKVKKSSAVGPASVFAALAAVPLRLLLTTDAFGDAEVMFSCFVILLALVVVVRHQSNIKKMIGCCPPEQEPASS